MTTPQQQSLPELTDQEKSVLAKVLKSHALQLLIGAEEWDLSEPEEMTLWDIIHRLEGK